MSLHHLKLCAVLVATLLFLAVPPLVHPANFKIKRMVVTGDLAPGGGTFTQFGGFAMNNPGAIAFVGNTSSPNSQGIYLAKGETVNRLVQEGDIISGDLSLPGLVGKEIKESLPFIVHYKFSDGRTVSCQKVMPGFSLIDPLWVDDFGNVVFEDSSIDFGSGGPVLYSGGVLTRLHCPALDRLISDLIGPVSLRKHDIILSTVSNKGVVALRVLGSFHFLITGGAPSLFPLVGTPSPQGRTVIDASILAINDSGDVLVHFADALTPDGVLFPYGLFLESRGSRTPIAMPGAPAPDGRTFRDILSGAMNNAGEIVFLALLSNFRQALFHRAPDGTLTALVQQGDPSPGGGGFFDFFNLIDLNDNGDVAFRSSNGIFFLSAEGDLSKVVRRGDTAPGGGQFATIGALALNNQGQIAFSGSLSNGKSGIFLASPGLETEFVDPVPDLLAGQAVTFDPAELAKNGRMVTGIAADGTAQVVVRVKTGQPGTVEFSLVDGGGQGARSLAASNVNGALGQVGASTAFSMVSVPTVDVQGIGPMAFAAYYAPMDFANGPNTFEASQPDRQVFIKIKLTTSTGETVESTQPLKIVRPPVVLVHGLWDSPMSWNSFSPFTAASLFSVNFADYEDSNAKEFSFNVLIVARQIRAFVQAFKLTEHVAAIQADVITHSMGGLLVRSLPLLEDAYFREDNFGLGDIHKLVNITSPHLGTPLASFLHRSPCVSQFFNRHGRPTDQGAVDDLVPNSQALNLINDLNSPIRFHQIVGLAAEEDKLASEFSLAMLWLRLRQCRRDFRGLPLSGLFDTILQTPDHDLIVPALSQRGNATGNFTLIPDVIHTRVLFFFAGFGVLESSNVAQRVVQLLNTPVSQPNFAP